MKTNNYKRKLTKEENMNTNNRRCEQHRIILTVVAIIIVMIIAIIATIIAITITKKSKK